MRCLAFLKYVGSMVRLTVRGPSNDAKCYANYATSKNLKVVFRKFCKKGKTMACGV